MLPIFKFIYAHGPAEHRDIATAQKQRRGRDFLKQAPAESLDSDLMPRIANGINFRLPRSFGPLGARFQTQMGIRNFSPEGWGQSRLQRQTRDVGR